MSIDYKVNNKFKRKGDLITGETMDEGVYTGSISGE